MIRSANVADVAAIQLIAKLSLEFAYSDLLSKDVQEKFLAEHYSQDKIQSRIQETDVKMLETDAGTVGFTIYDEQEKLIHIQALYILPEHQRKGAGTTMIKWLIQYSESRRKNLVIDLESRNVIAQKFYAKNGFELDHNYPFDLYGQPLKRSYLIREYK